MSQVNGRHSMTRNELQERLAQADQNAEKGARDLAETRSALDEVLATARDLTARLDKEGQARQASESRASDLAASLAEVAPKGSGWRGLDGGQRRAILTGAIASFLLVLSVFEVTEAIAILTGMQGLRIVLAALLAIGIDCGLVMSEVNECLDRKPTVRRWARIYMTLATTLSCLLNAYGLGLRAPEGYWSFRGAVALGIVIPILVLILAREAVHAWSCDSE